MVGCCDNHPKHCVPAAVDDGVLSNRFCLVRPTVAEVKASAVGWVGGRQLPGS
jgi:hypothetical protein